MNRLIGAAVITAATLLQVTWAPRLEVAGAFPNLMLVAVVAITWCYGARVGMAWACIGGILLDLTSTGPIGPHALALLSGAYITGFWVRNVHRDAAVHVMLAAALSTAVYSTILIGADDTLGLPVPPVLVAAELTVAACLYNAILAPLGLVLVRMAGRHTADVQS